MEKKGPQRLAECSFHENGHQLLCRLELISVHAIALVGEGWLRLAEDSVLHAMLDQLGVSVQALNAPFQPESGAYGGGHHHSHGKDSVFQYAPRLHQFCRDGSPDDSA